MSNKLFAASSSVSRPPLLDLDTMVRTHGALDATAVLLGVTAYRTEAA